ncbi:MAG: radical SAM protein [Euryarchaeota archaeon]
MTCRMVELGYERAERCEVQGRPACRVGLRNGRRLIHDAHLSRPEHYYSVYQSCCNWECKFCHSWRFTQRPVGTWWSPEDFVERALEYRERVTVWEPRERATAFHAHDLCLGCGRCVLGERPDWCPGRVDPDDIVPSPQGWGPARNIVAFTGGDLTCRPDFYVEAIRALKRETDDLWVLLESNGFGLVREHVEELAAAGLDSVWLDIKAWDEETHRKLTGATNRYTLESVELLRDHDIVVEVCTLYIPGHVEADQILRIAHHVAQVDRDIPFTILAYFPEYKLSARPPLRSELETAERLAREVAGLRRVRIGNEHVALPG